MLQFLLAAAVDIASVQPIRQLVRLFPSARLTEERVDGRGGVCPCQVHTPEKGLFSFKEKRFLLTSCPEAPRICHFQAH